MFYGVVINGTLMITDASHGKPIIEIEPIATPRGYHNEQQLMDNGTQIVVSYEMVPDEGSAEQAALELTRLQFMSLPDEAAYPFRALAPTWQAGVTYYGPNERDSNPQSRVLLYGNLYKCLQTHVAEADWVPTIAPSLWARILPGQAGSGQTVGEWQQPGSTNGYMTGERVTHNGHLWESTADNNVWEPGAVGAPWTDLGEVQAS